MLLAQCVLEAEAVAVTEGPIGLSILAEGEGEGGVRV